MAKDSLTLELLGEVPLDLFVAGIDNFQGLVNALAAAVAPNAQIEWVIQDLAPGSATMTISGVSQTPQAIEQVVAAYENVGRSLQAGTALGYPHDVELYARKLTSILNGKIHTISLQTDEFAADITARFQGENRPSTILYALGAVEGTVETLTRRRKLRFTLYDPIYDRAVPCYVTKGMEHIMRDIWGKRVFVLGRVGRDRETGQPVKVVEVSSIELSEENAKGGFSRAAGVLRGLFGDELPEDVIRRFRDAW